jgi:hypothetical protein
MRGGRGPYLYIHGSALVLKLANLDYIDPYTAEGSVLYLLRDVSVQLDLHDKVQPAKICVHHIVVLRR